MDLFNFFPSLERSNEAYFGQSSPLAQDLLTYSGKLKELLQDVDIKQFKNKEFKKTINSILIDFGEAVKFDINAEKVTFLLNPDKSVNASAYPIFIRANTTGMQDGKLYLDLDKIADIEDIIITSEGYKYRNKKNKLLCINLNLGLFQNIDSDKIAGVIAHEIGHCFQDGIFGIYKDVADMTFVNLQETGANIIEYHRKTMPKFIQGLSKVVGFRLLFIIFTYLKYPQYLFTTGLFSGLGTKIMKLGYKPIHNKENKTYRMSDQLKKIDNGDEVTKKQISSSAATQVLTNLNKDNDRKKFIESLKKDNESEWKIYIENSENLEPVKNKFIEAWKKITLQIDRMDRRIVNILTLSRFTKKNYSKVTFYKRWEFFADIFATSYGFGPETYNFLADSVTEQLDNLDMSLYQKYHLYKEYIDNSEYDVHGTNKQRLQNIYTDLMHELQTNTELTSEQRKLISNQIDQLKRISEQVYENRKVNSKSALAKAYNRLIDDRINDVSHETEEELLKPIDDFCKEVFVGKYKQEIKASLEHYHI